MRTVFVLFDTLVRKALEPYGREAGHTPNFARFAERAVTFDSHRVGSLPCIPARRDMQTGRLGFLHRGWGPIEPFDNSFPEILGQAGVYTHLVTDHFHYLSDGGATYHTRYASYDIVRGNGVDHWKGVVAPPLERFRREFSPREYSPYRVPYFVNRLSMQEEKDFCTPQVFSKGLEFIETNRSADNWFLQIEAFDPHEPFFAPARFRERYPTNYAGGILDWPNYGRERYDDDEAAEARANYSAVLAMCDSYFGRLLDAFDAHDMWKDTALIVSTDHGYLLGEHDWWGKNVMPIYDELAHIPLMIHHPAFASRAGERRGALTQTIDLMPTFLEIHGAPIPPEVRGKSLLGVLDRDRPVREAAIYGYYGAACNITDGRYTYLRYPEHMEVDDLFEYTLMPTRNRRRFTPAELAAATLAPPFDFTRGAPVLRVRAEATGDNLPAVMANRSYEGCVTALYDTKADPGQLYPVEEAAVVERLCRQMAGLFAECDAPPEAYERFGLGPYR